MKIDSARRAFGLAMVRAAMSCVLAVAVVGGLAGVAAADDYDDKPFDKPRTELGFGMYAGGFDVGPVGGAGVGVHLDAGRRMGNLMLYGEYAFLGIGENSYEVENPIRGHLHRLGVNARYAFADFGGGRYTPVKGAFWLEGGLGHQRVLWERGGKLDRADVSFGFGAEVDIRQRRAKKPKFWSIYYAFRMTVTEAPGKAQMEPTCGGPCDEPTLPSPYDLGFFFNMGFTFGR